MKISNTIKLFKHIKCFFKNIHTTNQKYRSGTVGFKGGAIDLVRVGNLASRVNSSALRKRKKEEKKRKAWRPHPEIL